MSPVGLRSWACAGAVPDAAASTAPSTAASTVPATRRDLEHGVVIGWLDAVAALVALWPPPSAPPVDPP